ncbi:MAG TPA: hypothetical protein VEL75_13655 [Candidatus Methylomirabilis sp.]|nr:hypothetical protein [Candidatus Methylomirabilis sp.]
MTTPWTTRSISWLIGLILVQLVVAQSLGMFPRLIAIDFYQYWAVAAAPRLSDESLGSPYVEHRTYHAVVRDWAKRAGETRLTFNGRVLGPMGFTATPFLYVIFAVFPADYTLALVLFHSLQILLFVAAVILLGVTYRFEMFPLLCLALLLALGSGPVNSDLRLGNLGCLQFAALSALLYLACRLPRSSRPAALGSLVLAGLTLVAIAKPNVALVSIAMAVHLWVARGTRFFFTASIAAAVSAAAAAVIPCLYFRSWRIWSEWYQVVFGRSSHALARPITGGNYSPSLLIARWLHIDVWIVTAAIAAILAASTIAVIAVSARESGRGWRAFRDALARAFGRPEVAMAIGVTMTISLPLLVWYHYYVIALIPGLWLLNASSGSRYLSLCGLASLVLSSGLLNVLFLPLDWTDAAGGAAALSWVPLWGGVLLWLHSSRAETEPAAAGSPAPRPEGRRAGDAPPGRPRRSKSTSPA